MELDPPTSVTSAAADANWRGESPTDSSIMVSLSKFKASDAVTFLRDLPDDYPDIRLSAMLYEVPIPRKRIPNALVCEEKTLERWKLTSTVCIVLPSRFQVGLVRSLGDSHGHIRLSYVARLLRAFSTEKSAGQLDIVFVGYGADTHDNFL
jgi:hypothetical protein